MEEYRKKLKKDLMWDRILIIIFLCLFVLVIIVDKSKLLIGYTAYTGMLGGLLGTTIVRYRNAKKALKDEESFKKAYVVSHDERNVMMLYRTAGTTFAIIVYGLAITGIIASFFNVTVSITLLVTVLVVCVVYLATYWYYSKRM